MDEDKQNVKKDLKVKMSVETERIVPPKFIFRKILKKKIQRK